MPRGGVTSPGGVIPVQRDAKGRPWNCATWWPWAKDWSEQPLPHKRLLELQSEPHRHGNKGNRAASHSQAPLSICMPVTFPGLSRSHADKSQKNCKCGSL